MVSAMLTCACNGKGWVASCKRQQAADLAAAVEVLAVVLAFDLEGEGIVLWVSAPFSCAFFASVLADDFAERDGLAQRDRSAHPAGFSGSGH
jgi:hypothetical protein